MGHHVRVLEPNDLPEVVGPDRLDPDHGPGVRDHRRIGDAFEPDGGAKRLFEPHWWEAGRYVELFIRTACENLADQSVADRSRAATPADERWFGDEL